MTLDRELEEESGVQTSSLRQVGLLIFEFIGEAQLLEVHVFCTEEFAGTVIETEGNQLPCYTDYCVPQNKKNMIRQMDSSRSGFSLTQQKTGHFGGVL